jgi:hypothetical protein
MTMMTKMTKRQPTTMMMMHSRSSPLFGLVMQVCLRMAVECTVVVVVVVVVVACRMWPVWFYMCHCCCLHMSSCYCC